MSDPTRAWAIVARRLGFSLSLWALLPVGFLCAWVLLFRAPASAVVPHLILVGSLCAAIAGLRLLLGLTVGERTARAASAALLTIASLAMLVYYGLVFVGLTYWGRVISVELMRAYVPQSDELVRALGYPLWLPVAAFATLAVLAWIAAYGLLRRFDWVAPLRQAISPPVAGFFGSGLLLIAAVSAARLSQGDWVHRSEPVSLSLFPDHGSAMQSHFMIGLRSSQLDREEDTVRAAYQPSKKARQSNVIVIVGDALRADHLSLLGYARPTSPTLEALASAGALRLAGSAVAVCSESSCGLRALASSRYVDRQATRPITLQEVLKRHGYRVNLLLSGDHTRFYGLRESYGPVDSYFDGASQTARYFNDDRLVIDRLRAMGPWDGRPVMFQFHLMSSHVLGKRFDETPGFGPAENYSGPRSWRNNDADFRRRAVNFYDRGALQADRVTGEILELLEAGGYLQDALVVVTGDHGESLGEHGGYLHSESVWEHALRVPFVMLAFGEAALGQLETGPVASQVDIAPTLLRALEMPIPSSWEGRPMNDSAGASIVYFQQAQSIGLIDARTEGKLYKHWRDVSSGAQFTFDLLADPGETRDVSSTVPAALRLEWQRLLLSRSAAIVSDGEERLNRRRGAQLETSGMANTKERVH